MTDAQLQSSAFQAAHPWGAVFVSYVMNRAGAGRAFPYSAAHQTYIRAAVLNRRSRNTANPFWAFRPTEVVPRVGDLVCGSRQNSGATYENIADPQPRATQCHVVSEVRPGQIRVIGGNVGQTVGERWLRTLPDGRVSLTGSQSGVFAVIRCRSRRRSPPGRPNHALDQTPQPATGGLNARVLRVMELLVNRYGYPVNGAAGVVGNLIAESAVLPNRVEGSDAATPMRAPDLNGQVRDFTPDEVRDRDVRRRIGPRYPGFGIAQWTSPERRAGLFRHTFQGRQLGAAIASHLDAQVDYLVNELRQRYLPVNVALMALGVTVEQASDAVLLRFEVPAAVVNRPPTDPTVQRVRARRRALAVRALEIYRGARQNVGIAR